MSAADEMLAKVNRTLDIAEKLGEPIAALMFSLPAFETFKKAVPRKAYRQRKGTRFVNAYRGLPIELHDEWSWGWAARPTKRTRDEQGIAA